MNKIRIPLTREKIDELVDEYEGSYPLNKVLVPIYSYVVPHWDWAKNVKPGAVQVHSTTYKYILNKVVALVGRTLNSGEAMQWINAAPSTLDKTVPVWVAQIDFDFIKYKEI